MNDLNAWNDAFVWFTGSPAGAAKVLTCYCLL